MSKLHGVGQFLTVRRARWEACFVIATAFSASLLWGQQAPAPPTAQTEHKWLEQFVGEWESVTEGSPGEGQPQIKCEGTISARMIGPFWVVSEWDVEVMGQPMTSLQTIGYDADSKKYLGTWVDSALPHLWHYEGTVDATGKKLVLEADGPNFMGGGKLTKYRDAYEFKSPDDIEMTSSMLGEDGKWVTFMSGKVTRKKQ